MASKDLAIMLYRLSRPAGFLGKPSTNRSRALNKQKDVKLLTELLWSRGHSQKYIKRFLFKTNNIIVLQNLQSYIERQLSQYWNLDISYTVVP